MCNKTLMDKIPSDVLRNRLKIPDIGEMLRRARLRWFGHVMRKDDEDWVKKCMNLTVEGTAPRGPKKTWRKTVDADLKLKGLKVDDCMNRPRWRKGLRRTMSLESESEPEQDQP